ncbi:hypothetical protein AMJ44_12185 [candidate division WOR-1 bacterium DG_54_3]|uniref:Uncharacterized protein n=1 Tax=candidate division WOR-1 bacterium DG_54_3 TaxID=1703775 RepID=A0A0S7XQH0_UNCSA|nr:MAG: hypothetical protein AMJ44_12185 [candidate division WOR-1 bacterium DG_54_3]
MPLIIPNIVTENVTFDESESGLLIAAEQPAKKTGISRHRHLLDITVKKGRIFWNQYLKSGESKIRWGEYPLELEYHAALLKGQKINSSLATLKKSFRAIIEEAKYTALSEKNPKKRMVAVIKQLFSSSPLRFYKRNQALLPLLLDNKGGNCEAEMKFLLGLFIALFDRGVDLGGYIPAIQCFRSHVRFVLYNKEKNMVFDPMSNTYEKGLREDLYDPHFLLFAELKGAGQKHLKAPQSLILAKKTVGIKITRPFPDIQEKSNTFLDFTFARPSSSFDNTPPPKEAKLKFNEDSGKIIYIPEKAPKKESKAGVCDGKVHPEILEMANKRCEAVRQRKIMGGSDIEDIEAAVNKCCAKYR